MDYDALGRLLAVWLPDWPKAAHPTRASRSFAYTVRSSGGPTSVAQSDLNTTGSGVWTSYTLYDGFLRPRQTQAKPPSGSGRILTDTYYDSRGLVVKTNNTWYTTGTPGTTLIHPGNDPKAADAAMLSQTRTTYDGAGRTTNVALWSQNILKYQTTTVYGGDRVDVTPPAGGTATSTWLDARGNTAQLWQYHAPTPNPATPGAHDATLYTYDHAGRLVGLTDPSGIGWSWQYDLRGRQTSATDPDRGTTVSSYDDAGQLTSTTDARGITITHVYDDLGRQTQTWQGSKDIGTLLTSALYDTILNGQPTSKTRHDNGNAYTSAVTGYDAGYRPTGTTVTIPAAETGLAGSYAFATSYNENGSIKTQTLPAAGGLPQETLTTTYTTMGQPRKLTSTTSGTTTYVYDTAYLQTGQVTGLTYQSPTTAYMGINFNPATQRLDSYTVQAATTPDVLSTTTYSYDDAGNIAKISDQLEQYGPGYGPDDTQCFDYDYLRRLTQAWTPDNNDCTTTPTVPGLGGRAPYWLNWQFDTTGNRTQQVEHTASGDLTTNYTYPLPTQPQPHTLTATTGAIAGSYDYDDAGNTTSRPGAGQQTLAWDAEGHLASLTEDGDTSSYVYDANGQRLVARDATGTTLYLPAGMELHVDPSGNNATCTRVYTHAGHTIASATSGTGLSWLFTDHQGTALLAVGASDMSVTRRHQTPYGTSRDTTPATWPNQHGYLGGHQDDSNLTHLGAREYDPTAGRFISDDPITITGDHSR